MKNYFNDSPIENTEDDRYGVSPFALALAKSILNIEKPLGTTIALHGPWGSGKSSAVNLIRSALDEKKDEGFVVTEFKCWWYTGEEALALAFLQNLNAILSDTLKDKVKNLVPKLGRGLLQAGPIVGSAIALTPAGPLGLLVGGTFDFAKRFFPEGDTLESTFQKLASILEGEDRRFLIIIDDIDRLNPEEALAIFRLVKSVGRLPNVIYLLVFDRALAEAAVREKYPSEGPHFLEKIIQAGFELPSPLQTDLNEAILASVSEICGQPEDDQVVRFMNLFYDVVAPYITSPRHVARFQNAISVTWPAIANEVNVADFVALEVLRLYEPDLFGTIRLHKNQVCGTRQDRGGEQDGNSRFDAFLIGIPKERHELVKTALRRLFPSMEDMGYGGEWVNEWSSERRVCVETHFDSYFRLSLSDEALSSQKVAEIINQADKRDFIQSNLREAAQIVRKGGASMVPVYLDELTTHGKRIEKSKVEELISALFEIHDEIDLENDAEKGMMAMANTSLRYHWLIRRLTRDRFSLDERTEVYLKATEKASLGWLVDFVSSAKGDYQPRDNKPPTREEDCLVSEDALGELTERALNAIRAAAANGTLIDHRDLLYILYRWADLMDNDASEVRAWTDAQLENKDALVVLARAMTGKSWTSGMGGFGALGDRVAKVSTTAQISDDTVILDTAAFRAALEQNMETNGLDTDAKQDVQKFLDAWDRKLNGDDDW
ncbi:KAP family P-loop NTPase fold protein [Maritalea porphyrae]|uniref:KAP family P-loop NTPase fold protein n=1 Tax=Maritalea porphyrae TaxID=880732 RepID=UPI0022AF990D|nr:P-loop NTPase fold protein [Maritalea porphyrae]MCZ4273380.1 P-loop NTPase fold protein [Maritalea porphyrae]